MTDSTEIAYNDKDGFPIGDGLSQPIDDNGFPIYGDGRVKPSDSNGFPIQDDGRVEPSDGTGFPVSYGAADYLDVPNEAEPSATMLGQPAPDEASVNRPKMFMGVGVLPDGGLSGLADNLTPGTNS